MAISDANPRLGGNSQCRLTSTPCLASDPWFGFVLDRISGDPPRRRERSEFRLAPHVVDRTCSPWTGCDTRAAPGSWWERRYGRHSLRLNVAASAPTVGLVTAFVTPYLYPYQESGGRLGPREALLVVQSYVLAVLVVGAVVAPVVGVVFGRATHDNRWRSFALLSGALALVLLSLIVAYAAGAFRSGF